MKYESTSYAAPRPEWTYSVQAPQILPPLWVLERLAGLGVAIAGLSRTPATRFFGSTRERLSESVMAGADENAEARGHQRRPPLVWLVIVVALTLTGGLELGAALRSPGQRMHSELAAAAADLQSVMPIMRSDAKLVQLRRHFREHDVSIDATFWPVVSVTLHHLDASTCRDAADKVRRIEGLVVIALERYRAADECHEDNDMTWRIMP